MKKNAFTLVELLAVIIILGILSTLIVPKVMKTLNDSEEKSNLASANGLLKAAEYKYQDNEINGISENIVINFGTGQNVDKLDFNGKNPDEGVLTITTTGNISMAVKIGDKCYIKQSNAKDIVVQDYNSNTCSAS